MSKQVMDGNEAAAYISYAFTEVAGIYPITPSSQMAEFVDVWSTKGKKNIFGNTVEIVEMQSEAGAAGVVHGSLAAGALTTTYTASQGLLLKIPNMYKISGELLPGVFHVSARSLSVHGLSIFGDHSDVMACRQTGFALLAATSPQEVMDLGAVAHLSAIKGRVPFLHFFDGFRTSHELQKIDTLDYDDLAKIVDMDAVNAFRKRSLNPERPVIRGTTQNPDIYFQGREACNTFFDELPDLVMSYMDEINQLTGRNYHPFDYYGAKDATRVIVAMGSVCETAIETVNYLLEKGEKVGLIVVRLYRPFAAKYFFQVLPETVERIAVLDRTKEPGSLGEPLYQDVCTAFYHHRDSTPLIIGGRYGLASKDTTPAQIIAVFEHLAKENPHNSFTVGIEDDVTHLSIPVSSEEIVTSQSNNYKIWGMGSDGTVGANKNTTNIVGDKTDLYCQTYFVYDSKKSGGITQSHIRFSKQPIHSTYLVNQAELVACHQPSYLKLYDILDDLVPGGIFLLNCKWTQEEMEENLPAKVKVELAKKKCRFYAIDAVKIAEEIGLGGKINTILQAAFFKLTNIIPLDVALQEMKETIGKTYFNKGDQVIQMNVEGVERGIADLWEVTIPEGWINAKETEEVGSDEPEFISNIVRPMNRLEGDNIPVSAFDGIEDGTFPVGTCAYEKRGIAIEVPMWHKEHCIQCNQCVLVCAHAALRPFLLDEQELVAAPEGFETLPATGKKFGEYAYRLQVSPLDCYGCDVCVNVCPAKVKALSMKPLETQMDQKENWNYAIQLSEKKFDSLSGNIKETQFAQPLFEFSGACAGCGETPYIKLATQLFGDRMYIANASGCSSAYGGSTPSVPYTMNQEGKGPAWAMSLFEDNAEFAYGMLLGAEKMKHSLAEKVAFLLESGVVAKEAKQWLEGRKLNSDLRIYSEQLLRALEAIESPSSPVKEAVESIQKNREYLTPKSYWAFGGDGWAYDIGFGGLDHVLASGANINMLVMDTEGYSNTGGQASKATPIGAIAQFAAGGKRVSKKDLGLMAISYGYIYVAQIAMGANQNQTLKALKEAESYPGPSLVIAYSPCIAHGIKTGLANREEHTKKAVESGYWHLYRYNPLLKEEGKNPFILDSKPPTLDFKEFLMEENRYAALMRAEPEMAEELFEHAAMSAKERYENYRRLVES